MTNIPENGYIVDDEGCLNVWLRGVPYGGPAYLDGSDLDGEKFTEKTDFGPLKQLLCYFDHGKLGSQFSDDHPAKAVLDKFSKTLVGSAFEEMTDDEGIIYKIVVDRAYAYQNFIKRLAEEKLFKGSTTPFQRSVIVNEKTGDIEQWHLTELTLTVTPSNPDAEQVYGKILKEFGEELMAKKTADEQVPVPPGFEDVREKSDSAPVAEAVAATPATTPVVAEPATAVVVTEVVVTEEETVEPEAVSEEKSTTARIQEIFGKKIEEPVSEKATVQDLAQVLALFNSISISISGYSYIDNEKTVNEPTPTSLLGMMKTMQEKIAKVDGLAGDIDDIKTALPEIAKGVLSQLQGNAEKSVEEIRADRAAANRAQRIDKTKNESDLPDNAPR